MKIPRPDKNRSMLTSSSSIGIDQTSSIRFRGLKTGGACSVLLLVTLAPMNLRIRSSRSSQEFTRLNATFCCMAVQIDSSANRRAPYQVAAVPTGSSSSARHPNKLVTVAATKAALQSVSRGIDRSVCAKMHTASPTNVSSLNRSVL